MNRPLTHDELPTIVGFKVVAPECSYDYSRFGAMPKIVQIVMQFVISARSTNTDRRVQARTNGTMHRHVCMLLNTLLEDGRDVLDQELYTKSQETLERKYSVKVRYHMVLCMRRVFKFAFAEKLTRQFLLPPTPSQPAIALSAPDNRTLADQIEKLPDGIADRIELNRVIMEALIDYCWTCIHELRRCHEQSQRWRREIPPELIGVRDRMPGFKDIVTREKAIEIVVKAAWRSSDGFFPQDRCRTPSPVLKAVEVKYTKIVIMRFLANHPFEPALTVEELSRYTHPTMLHLTPIFLLLASVGLNPTTIAELKQDGLRQWAADENFAMLGSTKHRAGGDRDTGPMAAGGRNSRTIPRALEVLSLATAGLRELASPELADYAFIHAMRFANADGGVSLCNTSYCHAMELFKKQIDEDDNPRFAILRMMTGPVQPAVVRTTMGNLKRFKGDFEQARKFFRHKSSTTTDIYLNNAEYRAFLTQYIRDGQTQLVTHLSEKPKIVAADTAALVREEALSEIEAQALVSDDLNNSLGVSLIRGKSYVVDTPLNYLRMAGWLATMEAAAERLMIENYERWEGYWIGQIALFRTALADFPRRTHAQAEQLQDVDLMFPEPH